MKFWRAPIFLLSLCFSFALAPMAQADVVISFYSHDMGEQFPHGFVTIKGTINATGQTVDNAYGFTAQSVSPAILFGSVKGHVKAPEPSYIAKSDRQFTVTVKDAVYARVMAKVAFWRDHAQPSYNLGKRNCVHFIMDMAEAVGLRVNHKSKYFKKPKSFLHEVEGLNPGLK